MRQITVNPYSLEQFVRVFHTIALVPRGGFLLHGASAVRNGRAFLFSGVSGAGKSTISRLAPPDVTLLTDEISYICPSCNAFEAFGTPFAGDLPKTGDTSAPIAQLCFLAHGPENRLEPLSQSAAIRALMRNILFYSDDPELVRRVFEAACDFIARVPVYRLTFLPDPKVWELIS